MNILLLTGIAYLYLDSCVLVASAMCSHDEDIDEKIFNNKREALLTSLFCANINQIPLDVFKDSIGPNTTRHVEELHAFVIKPRLDNRPFGWHAIDIPENHCDVCKDMKYCDLNLVQLCTNGYNTLSLCIKGDAILKKSIKYSESWKELREQMQLTMKYCISKWRPLTNP